MNEHKEPELVLAIHPFARGFAFALFEGPLSPIDWGVKDIRGPKRNAQSLEAVEALFDALQPDALVLEDCAVGQARRALRIKRLLRLIANYAVGQSTEVHTYPRERIRQCFKGVGAVTRYEIAQAVAAQVHAFGPQLPPLRKLWESEDPRMCLFDAVSLVMTHYSAATPNAAKTA